MNRWLKSKFLALATGFAALLVLTSQAQAYDVDTHFYETYLMARYAGINHEVALQLSTFDAWIDASAMTSPMNPLLLTGERLRRLFHFPTPYFNEFAYGKSAAQFGVKIDVLDTAQPDTPMARELIFTALKKGNLMLAGAGLHVFEDSFGHSDFSPQLGHLEFGHNPDRPWLNYEKHKKMAEGMMRMLVVIRQALPDSALDKEYRDGGERPHVEMNAEELAQKYNNDQDIQNVIKKNTFEDPRYTRFVAEYLIKAGQERNIFAKTFNPESILQDRELFKSQSVEQIVTALVKKALSLPREERDQILNMKDILVTKMATYHLTEATYELLKGADKDKFQDEFIRRMVNHIIPTPSTDASAVRFEFDHAVRNAENHIRETDRKALIRKKTGRSVAFTEKTIEKVALEIADAVATGKALDGVAEIEDRMTKLGTLELANSEVATATKKQRWEWRMQMVKYIYIDLFTGLFGNLMKKLKVVGPKAQIGNTRFDPSRGTFYLMTNERAFRLMMQKGIFKKLITDKDVEALKTEHAARMKQLSDAGFDVKGAIERLATEQEGTPFEELVRGTSLRASSAPQCREIFLAN